MNVAYNLLLILLFPLLLPWLLWRRAKGKEDAARWGERWGAYPDLAAPGKTPRIWLHAVSVGETMAAAAVLRALRERFPDAHILLTTITVTGQEVAAKRPEADTVLYFPLDFPWAARRALDRARPDLVLLMEGEIWPNFLVAARRGGARIAVVNGRLSDRKLPQWRRIAPLIAGGLRAVDRFAMQSDEDARRIVSLGVDPQRVGVLGNTKFDESSVPLDAPARAALRRDLGIPAAAPVLVCGSTRESTVGGEDEEALVARAVLRIRERFPELHLVVAPRHVERADAVVAALPGAARRSRGEQGPDLVLDTYGELARVYAVADVAFVGGSLVPWGGQSVFQPLAQGVPALFGPHMNNQRDIAALARSEGVGFEVADADGLAEAVCRLLSLPAAERADLSHRARALIERNQGAAGRCADLAAALLGLGDA